MIRIVRLIDLCFIGTALIIFFNLNGIVFLLTGIEAAFSSLILGFCILISYFLFSYKKLTFPHKTFNVAIISFLVIGSCTWFLFNHNYHEVANYYKVFRKHLPAMVLLFAMYKYFIYVADRGKFKKVLFFITILLLSVTVLVPLGAFIPAVDELLKPLGKGGLRASGLFASPNLAGVHSNFTLAFVLFFILQSKRFSLLFVATVPIVLYAGVLTFSKATMLVSGTLVSLFVIYNLMFFFKIGNKSKKRFIVFLVVVCGGLVVSAPQIKQAAGTLNYLQFKRLTEVAAIAQGEVNEETTTDRSVAWKEAITMISKNPILGYGLSSFHNLPKFRLGTHNTYLMIWGEGGIVPFMTLLVFVLTVFYRSFFWIRDPSYRFLALSLSMIIFIQMYGAAHTGLNNSEVLSMVAILLTIIETQRGKMPERLSEIASKHALSPEKD